MRTSQPTTDQVLTNIPKGHRSELLKVFNKILKNFRERRWEPSALNGGKFCEVVYSILKGHTSGNYSSRLQKPTNMVDSCRRLEQADKSKFCRSVRIQIPRMLISLYEIRNNRGVGHVGGDVDPNYMDAIAVLYMVKWIMAELIRIFHKVDINTATETIERITDRTLPVLWKVGAKLRVLDTSLTMREKTLVILYYERGPIDESVLVDWIEHTNPSVYRRDVLRSSHKEKLIEYDKSNKKVQISPKGIKYVEESIDLADFF